jgi:two-component system cell cycle sensor histidine kinase/response regulator CckA
MAKDKEQKTAEESLTSLTSLKDLILRSASEGILGLDVQGNHTFVNPAAARMLGYEAEDLIGLPSHSLWHHSQPDGSPFPTEECPIRAAYRDGKVHRISTEVFWRKNGTSFPVEYTSTPICEQGQLVGAVMTFTDITGRKRAEEALRESEEKFRTFFESSRDAIMTLTPPSWQFTHGNPAAIQMFGVHDEADFISRAPWEYSPPMQPDGRPSDEKAKEMIETAMAQGSHFFEWTHQRLDEGTFSATVLLTRMEIGGQALLQATVRDITASKQAEEALRASQQITTSIINAIPLSVFWKDKDLVFLGCNTAFARDAGFDDPSDIIGKNDHQMSWRNQADLYREDDRSVIESGRSKLLIEEPQTTPEGRIITLLTSKVPLHDSKGGVCGILGAYMDITDRKQTEEKTVNLQKQLLHAQKMEAIGRLAGGIAHDFNNLLAVILSYTGFAMETIREGDPLGDDLMEVKKAGDRAAALTKQLLSFSRKQVAQPMALNLNQIATGVEKMLRRILGEDVELVQKYATDLGQIQADSGQMEQVLMNLAVNARDAMPEGGRLTLETSNVDLDKEYATSHADVTPGQYVLLSVTDTGCGMDEQIKSRLFEPFFTTKDKDKGTGLGLSTVYGIVNQSGGHIRVFSEVGHGTTFEVYLPRNRSAMLTTTTYPLKASKLFMGTETILLTEDEEAVRKLTIRILRNAGYTVLTAANGGEALLIGAQHSGVIHLLLTDVIMPRMNGKILAQELLKTRPTLKVLYMSGYTDNIVDAQGPIEESAHFIGKPFDAVDLTRKVRQILDS